MEEIVALAKALGRVPQGQEEVLEALCQAAWEQLAGRLREGVAPEDCGGAFQLACAWTALAGLEAGGGVERFTAGSVSIQTGEGGARAAALREQAEAVLVPWLDGGGFHFRGVPG